MKKFLSLVLAMIMTMSLVTISAGATEYEELTDKDEIVTPYEEAVAVLNKIGVITGYEDGSFRPEVELTRGAAAKIIVSLLIGPEAASNLPNNYAPYPDVPTGHTFAGVISYCKTAKIINGYSDGTFKPSGTLTGFAFAKMLLGALGYNVELEGLNGSGWTMNAAALGQAAGLFDRLDFKGNEAVTRKDAALLALNTLKATCVQYSNGVNVNVTGENTNVVVSGGQIRSYKTSNQDFAKNIKNRNRQLSNDDYWTVEFAEEHFVDLRLENDRYQPTFDAYGRPATKWTYKKVSVGTYPLAPDFEYTTQVAHNVETVTDAAKVRALNLSGCNTDNARMFINGAEVDAPAEVADIANYTDNGTLVQVYLDYEGADSITHIVVVKTQLMEVKRIASDYVDLDNISPAIDAQKDPKDLAGGAKFIAYNAAPINVNINRVESDDAYFELLHGLKEGDTVAVVPLAIDNVDDEYEVGYAYVPETVSGALTHADMYGTVRTEQNAIAVTVGGTKYNVALWNKDLIDIDPTAVRVTKKDVTLILDEYGNALRAKDVGSTNDFMIIGNYRQGLVDGVIVTYANGWDIKGNAVSLNIGGGNNVNAIKNNYPEGTLVHYTNATNSNTAEWLIDDVGVYDVNPTATGKDDNFQIKASNTRIRMGTPKIATNGFLTSSSFQTLVSDVSVSADGIGTLQIDDGIKFVYINSDLDEKEVENIEVKNGVQNVTQAEIYNASSDFDHKNAQACVSLKDGKVTKDSLVKAVVIKQESNEANVGNLLYITNWDSDTQKTDSNGRTIQGYKVAMMTPDGKMEQTTIHAYRELVPGDFARYTKTELEGFDDFYTLRKYNDVKQRAASTMDAAGIASFPSKNDYLVKLKDFAAARSVADYNIKNQYYTFNDPNSNEDLFVGDSTAENLVNLKGAKWVDLTKFGIKDADQLRELFEDGDKASNGKGYDFELALLFNDKVNNDDFRSVYMVVVVDYKVKTGDDSAEQTTGAVTIDKNEKAPGTVKNAKVETLANGNSYMTFTLVKPEWAAIHDTDTAGDSVSVGFDVYVDGKLYAYGTSIANAASSTWGSASSTALVGNNTADADKATEFTVTNYNLSSIIPASDAAGKTISVVLKNVSWKNAVVEYKLGDQKIDAINAEYLTTATTGGALDISGYSNPAYDGTAGYTITGAATAGTDKLTSDDITDGDLSSVYALGGQKVVVTITGLTKSEKVSATTKVYDDTVGGLFAATKIGKILNAQTDTSDYDGVTGTLVLTLTPAKAGESLTVASGQLEGKLTSGNQYKIKATYAAVASDGWDQFDVEVTVKEGSKTLATVTKTFSAAGDSDDSPYFTVTGDITVEVKVTPKKAATLETVTYADGFLTMTFSKEIDGTSVVPSSFLCDNSTVVSQIKVEGKSITMRVEGVADGDTVTPNGAGVTEADKIKDADGIPVDNSSKADFDVDGSGVVTVAKA